MKHIFLLAAIILLKPCISNALVVDTLKYGSFGKVYIYKPATTPDAFVVFVSGEGGWNENAIKMGSHFVAQGALVVGIDLGRYLKNKANQHEKCLYPAGDIEELSMSLQKKYKFPGYFKPILVGYSSGASFVYGTLAQAPANTFKGAIGLGFCPDFKCAEPLCTNNQLKQHAIKPGLTWYLEPAAQLSAPFIVINGIDDKVCSYQGAVDYMKKVGNGEIIGIPNSGQGMSAEKNYQLQLISAYDKIRKSASYAERVAQENHPSAVQKPEKLNTNLPLIILSSKQADTLPMIVLFSGDGGWTSFDESVAEKLVEKGISLVGIDCQKYFWQERTPEETAMELIKVINYYLGACNKRSFSICGYSFGADVIPFMVTRLPADLRLKLRSAVMMSPDPNGDFEIHIADMLSLGSGADKYNVLAELKKSTGCRKVCIFGKDEGSETPNSFSNAGARIVSLPGSHHYNNDYDAVANAIINSFH